MLDFLVKKSHQFSWLNNFKSETTRLSNLNYVQSLDAGQYLNLYLHAKQNGEWGSSLCHLMAVSPCFEGSLVFSLHLSVKVITCERTLLLSSR